MPKIKPVPLLDDLMTTENLIDLDLVEPYLTGKVGKINTQKIKDGDNRKDVNLLFVLFIYLLDADFPSIFYENLSNSKSFMKLLDELTQNQKKLIQLFLHQQEGHTISNKWTLWIKYLKDQYELY